MDDIDRKRVLKVIEGLMEIAEMAMPDSFFWSDSRTQAARKQMKILKSLGLPKLKKPKPRMILRRNATK